MASLINGIGQYLLRGSIVHALDETRLMHETAMFANTTLPMKAVMGTYHEISGIPRELLINFGLGLLFSKSIQKFQARDTDANGSDRNVKVIIASAIYEEIIFRGILQNAIGLTQLGILAYASPASIDGSRFRWLLSPTAKILIVNTIFALCHWTNDRSDYVLNKIHVLKIALRPSESILHHTTGNIVAPIFAHITNNLIGAFLF